MNIAEAIEKLKTFPPEFKLVALDGADPSDWCEVLTIETAPSIPACVLVQGDGDYVPRNFRTSND